MSEFLIEKNNLEEKTNRTESNNSSAMKENLFDFDVISNALKNIRSGSNLRKTLSSILGSFYCYPLLIISLSFLLGFLILGLSSLLLFYIITKNIVKPLLIVSIFTMVYSLSLLVIRIYDDRRNPALMAAKWERKNILSNFGLFWTCLILTISFIFMHSFYTDINEYKEAEDMSMIYIESPLAKELMGTCGLKYLLNLIFVEPHLITTTNRFFKVKYYISEIKREEIEKTIHNDIFIFSIPLLIFCFNKFVKGIFIEIKYSFSQFLIYLSGLLLCVLVLITKYLPTNFYNYFSLIQIILLSIMYLGYLTWVIHSSFKFILRPKDSSFSIRKYRPLQKLIVIVFDFAIIIGSTLIFMSFLFFYIAYKKGEENYKNLRSSFSFLKIGFLLLAFGNSYYYGHYLLAMIFKPIAQQYAPAELKNEHYIRPKKNLLNSLARKKSGLRLKMRDVIKRKK